MHRSLVGEHSGLCEGLQSAFGTRAHPESETVTVLGPSEDILGQQRGNEKSSQKAEVRLRTVKDWWEVKRSEEDETKRKIAKRRETKQNIKSEAT